MATRELITKILGGGDSVRRDFNISATVGTRGKNEIGDVMLIQAMLKYFAMGSPKIADDAPQIKEISGIFNLETDRAIR